MKKLRIAAENAYQQRRRDRMDAQIRGKLLEKTGRQLEELSEAEIRAAFADVGAPAYCIQWALEIRADFRPEDLPGMDLAAVSDKVDALMAQVLPFESLASFQALPLRDRVAGLTVLAKMADEDEVAQMGLWLGQRLDDLRLYCPDCGWDTVEGLGQQRRCSRCGFEGEAGDFDAGG